MFKKLWIKELKGVILLPTLVAMALTIAFHIYLRTRSGVWPSQAILALGGLPMILPLIWPLIMGMLTFHFEWNTNSIYLLLSLPVKGHTVIAAKSTALLTGIVGLILTTLGSYALLLAPLGNLLQYWNWSDFFKIILILGIYLLAILMFFIITSQFAYLVSRLVPRLKGLVLVFALIFSYWISGKLGQWLNPVLSWIPKIKIPIQASFSFGRGLPNTLDLDLGALSLILLITAGFF
ncbi:MAG TPA: hypothetical protein VHY08_05745, partial [Bacillota bacterium]|nr:hypothetical protein [Bacillota bacterium]